jgi:hypothetical protein
VIVAATEAPCREGAHAAGAHVAEGSYGWGGQGSTAAFQAASAHVPFGAPLEVATNWGSSRIWVEDVREGCGFKPPALYSEFDTRGEG